MPLFDRETLCHPSARILIAAASLAAGNAWAGNEFSVGIGAGPSHGSVDCVDAFACDRSSDFAKVTAAWRLSDAFDLQATWFGGGRFKGGDISPLGTPFGGTFKTSALALAAGYTWNVAPRWTIAGRVGGASVRTTFDYQNAAFGSVGKTTVQPLAGLGVAYAITPTLRLGIDYDVTRFRVYRTRGPLQMLGVAAQFSF